MVPSATGSVPPSRSHDSNSHNNSKRSNDSTHSNTKATVHINGVAVDHFQQNSDVDEDRASMIADSGATCQNSDVQGFISYSSDSSMIELNLKFRKCACNENIVNLSKENLRERHQQQEQRSPEPSSLLSANNLLYAKSTSGEVTEVEDAATTTTTLFSKEGKSKKKLQLNKDNLKSLVNKLNDTNSASISGTKCRLSLDINNILNQVTSEKKLTSEAKMKTERETVEIITDNVELVGDGYNTNLEVVDEFDVSHSRAASWSPLLPSPCSPSPASSVAADCSSCLQRRHSENVECRSIGIQHGLKPSYNRKKHLRKGKTQAEEIIIISDEFRRQSISDQTVKIQKAKKHSKSMEMIERKQEKKSNALGAVECLHLEEDTLTIVVDQGVKTNGHPKSKSKSVDDISLNSEHNEEEFGTLANNANEANSVELIFITDEFVQRKSKTNSDVIILDMDKKGLKRKRSSNKNLIIISDDYKEKSSAVKNDVRIVKSSSLKGKDLRRKTTISNSNSFLTYEEPFSPETLENKDIGAMFAEAAAAASK